MFFGDCISIQSSLTCSMIFHRDQSFNEIENILVQKLTKLVNISVGDDYEVAVVS
jgi:hypothetical protein